VDGGNGGTATQDEFGVSIEGNSECLRCNVFGFTKNITTQGGSAGGRTLFQDDYSHDLSNPGCSHDNVFYMNSSDYFTIEHSYAIADNAANGCITGAITNLADYGQQHDWTVDSSYMEGYSGIDMYAGKGNLCGQPNVVVTNNYYSTNSGYGDYVSDWSQTGNTWSGNHTIDQSGNATALSEPSTASGCS
jgi:hypothetical protein